MLQEYGLNLRHSSISTTSLEATQSAAGRLVALANSAFIFIATHGTMDILVQADNFAKAALLEFSRAPL